MFPIKPMSVVLMEYNWNAFWRDRRTVLCTIDGCSPVKESYLPQVHVCCRDIGTIKLIQ